MYVSTDTYQPNLRNRNKYLFLEIYIPTAWLYAHRYIYMKRTHTVGTCYLPRARFSPWFALFSHKACIGVYWREAW